MTFITMFVIILGNGYKSFRPTIEVNTLDSNKNEEINKENKFLKKKTEDLQEEIVHLKKNIKHLKNQVHN